MKDYVLSSVERVFVFASIIFALTACGDSVPISEPTRALSFSVPVAVNQSALRIEGAWDTPKSLGSEPFNPIVESIISGFSLAVSDSGDLFSGWTSHSGFDIQSNRFQHNQNALFQFQVTDKIPRKVARTPTNNNTSIFRIDKSTGDIYALWQEQGLIKISRYQTASQWQLPKTIANGQWGDLSLNNNGDAVVFVVNQKEGFSSSISALLMSQTETDNTVVPLQRRNGTQINQISAILDTNKKSLIVWSETNNNVISLWSAEYSTLGGWREVQQISGYADVAPSTFGSISIANNPVISSNVELLFCQSQANGSNIIAASYRNGKWSALNYLASMQFGLDVDLDVDVAVNNSGSMAIVWREQQKNDTQNYLQLKSRLFDSSNGWSQVTSVSQSIQGSIDNVGLINVSKPKVFINEQNDLAVTWIEDGQSTSNLLVNHFNENSNEWSTPELVVSYTNSESSIETSSIVIDKNDEIIVAWQQKMKNSLVNEAQFWFSSQLGAGVVVEQPLKAMTLQAAQIVKPSAVWQPPIDVWTDTIFSNTVSFMHGPHIQASETGTVFLSLYKNTDFDPMTGGYLQQESVVLNNSTPSVWTQDQPFPSTSGIASNEVKIEISENGDAYALWLVDGTLYFNNYTPSAGWGTETNIGLSDDKHDLMFDTAGNVWIFWNSGGDINLQQYIPGSGLQTADTTTVPNAWYFGSPVIDANGAINISWISLTSLGSQPFTSTNSLNLIIYTPSVGWGFIEIAPPLNSFNSMSSELNLASTANDEVLAISQDTHGNIFGITFSGSNGWGEWENIDYNLDKNDQVARSLRVASNGVKNVMAIWSEETVDIDGSTVYRIYSNRFEPIADVNGIHWPIPERVGAIVPQFDSAGKQLKQFQTLPKIAVLGDGRAVATWLDSSESGSALFANQYVPGTGWGELPDEVISYDRLSTGIVISPDIAVLTSGKVLLSWRQEISTEFANEIHVWVTEGQM